MKSDPVPGRSLPLTYSCGTKDRCSHCRFFQVDELTTATSAAVTGRCPATSPSTASQKLWSATMVPSLLLKTLPHLLPPVTSIAWHPALGTHNPMARLRRPSKQQRTSFHGSDPRLALLEYRSTPVDNLASPAQLLMGRRLRSILPSASKHLQPMTVNPSEIIAKRQQAQTTQKMYHDRTAHQLPPLKPGDKVHVQLSKWDKWTLA